MFCLEVKDVIRHTKDISTLILEKRLRSNPGQFVMLNVFGYEEIPLSLSSNNSVTVKAVGETTRALVKFSGRELVGIRGPFGRYFSKSDNALIIAGGIGIAPLRYLYHELKGDVTIFYGAKNRHELIFLDEFDEIFISTDDGSYGFKGNVIQLLIEKGVDFKEFESIYCCGPEIMLKKLYYMFKKEDILDRVEFSIERYMRCGIGLCGSCVLKNGLRVCKEGPVFRGSDLPSFS